MAALVSSHPNKRRMHVGLDHNGSSSTQDPALPSVYKPTMKRPSIIYLVACALVGILALFQTFETQSLMKVLAGHGTFTLDYAQAGSGRRLRDPALDDLVTVVILTSDPDRFQYLQGIVTAVSSDIVYSVIIVWNDPSNPAGKTQLEAALDVGKEGGNDKVKILQSSKNSLNNRYDPDFLNIETGGVMVLDDDLYILPETLPCVHESWMAYNKTQVHSFGDARSVSPGGYDLQDEPPNFLLPRMMFHSSLLDLYFEDKHTAIRNYVDNQEAHCDDIAFASITSHFLQKPQVVIPAPHAEVWGTTGNVKWGFTQKQDAVEIPVHQLRESISHQKGVNRQDTRSECVRAIVRMLNWTLPPLEYSTCSYAEKLPNFDKWLEQKRKNREAKTVSSDAPPQPRPTDSTKDPSLRSLYEADENLQISRKHKVMFIHLPKTGGSLIENSKLFADKVDQTQQPAKGHEHVSQFLKRDGVGMFDSFAIVRHPCERFLSAFQYMAKGGRNNDDATWARENIGNMSMEEWVQDGIRADYFHFRPMWWYMFLDPSLDLPPLYNDGTNRNLTMGVNHVFCQEQYTEATDWVNNNFGMIFPETPRDNVGSHGSCKDIPEKTRSAIEEFYAMDYCLFGYQRGQHESQPQSCPAQTYSKEDFTQRFAVCASNLGKTSPQAVTTVPNNIDQEELGLGVNQLEGLVDQNFNFLGDSTDSISKLSFTFPSAEQRIKYYMGSWFTPDAFNITKLCRSVKFYPQGELPTTWRRGDPYLVNRDNIDYHIYANYVDDVKKYILGNVKNASTFNVVLTLGDGHDGADEWPVFIKSRRLYGYRKRNILALLHEKRHFGDVTLTRKDPVSWNEKEDKVVWRGATTGADPLKPGSRYRAVLQYINSTVDGIDIAFNKVATLQDSKVPTGPDLLRKGLPSEELEKFKYLVSIEGNDVATGLKWMLYSNSVVMMAPPTKETWAMEGLLVPYYHYIPLAKDLSDIKEKLDWARRNDVLCRKISQQATRFMEELYTSEKAKKDNILIHQQIARRYEDLYGAMLSTCPRESS
jgi:Glycosyl transferase family 64 domain/Glycosyl transferase family 90/Sulfotransferase family